MHHVFVPTVLFVNTLSILQWHNLVHHIDVMGRHLFPIIKKYFTISKTMINSSLAMKFSIVNHVIEVLLFCSVTCFHTKLLNETVLLTAHHIEFMGILLFWVSQKYAISWKKNKIIFSAVRTMIFVIVVLFYSFTCFHLPNYLKVMTQCCWE